MSRVKEVRLYGNGKAFVATHHVFCVLTTDDGRYHLLELTNGHGSSSSGSSGSRIFSYIQIHQASSGTLDGVLKLRSNTDEDAERWGAVEKTNTSWIEKLPDIC
ncbi:unnamed protein product [Adineta ricciae]|uniref:Uncharacterized protein n=1 Tax=Adineta ricciae TaxID=249248 RepID=A0A816GQL6_ADIRI|nr:unnamed protein product [Adineta ricciae]